MRILSDGRLVWESRQGQLHREDGPAIIYPDGTQFWYLNGQYHREDGPALIWPTGRQEWYLNGQLHREDGPAVLWSDGSQIWYLNGQRHREDGPAIIWADGKQEWWVNGANHAIAEQAQFDSALRVLRSLKLTAPRYKFLYSMCSYYVESNNTDLSPWVLPEEYLNMLLKRTEET